MRGVPKGCQQERPTVGIRLLTRMYNLEKFVVKHLPRGEFEFAVLVGFFKELLPQALMTTRVCHLLSKEWKECFFQSSSCG